MQLNWMKCQGSVWCGLGSVNLNHVHFNSMDGVYIIWHGGTNAETVYVGQGVVKDCLMEHRNDPDVQKYAPLGLYVTWASVAKDSRDGVEAYLAKRLTPKEGQHPNVPEIEVNLPW